MIRQFAALSHGWADLRFDLKDVTDLGVGDVPTPNASPTPQNPRTLGWQGGRSTGDVVPLALETPSQCE